jgi:hypothetical protein
MPRPKIPQVRVGRVERAAVMRAYDLLKSYRLLKSLKRKRETYTNDLLINYLNQGAIPLDVRSRGIPQVKFCGEKFRPEGYLIKGRNDVFCLECKRLTDAGKGKDAKRQFKEGLAQAFLYRRIYKRVFLVFYDFTAKSVYFTAFGRGNRDESRYARYLREKEGIYVVVKKAV